MLDMALAMTVQRQAKVLWAQMGTVSDGILSNYLPGKCLWGLLEDYPLLH